MLTQPAGLTTDLVRRILPFLEHPGQIAVHKDCLPETAALLREEAERIQRRIDCLARNRDAILGYHDGIGVKAPAEVDGPVSQCVTN
jgi:hypothetical protein